MEVLSRKVLILNADFRAFTLCSLSKAFMLVYLGKAEVVNRDEKAVLRSVNSTFDVPTVIRLHRYVNMPYKSVMLSRHNIFKRDGYKCVYCEATTDLTLDHVIPRSRGGRTSWTNLVTACKRCNSRKGDFTPEEAEMPLPYKPYRPSFIMFLREFSGMGDESWRPYLQAKSA